MRVAALLRGVNLGSRKLLSADLRRITEQMGYANVEPVLASGNVVFSTDMPAPEVERALEAALLDHGLQTDVLVRDGAELAAALAANPFPQAAVDHPSHLLVAFHRAPFPLQLLTTLKAHHIGPERLEAHGRELFIDYGGREQMRESKLLGAMNKARFPKVNTARNWNTVGKLAAMLGSPAP